MNQKRYSKEEYNNNEYINDCINESCFYCGEEFIHINDIFVDVISDRYLCKECSIVYGINVVRCRLID